MFVLSVQDSFIRAFTHSIKYLRFRFLPIDLENRKPKQSNIFLVLTDVTSKLKIITKMCHQSGIQKK